MMYWDMMIIDGKMNFQRYKKKIVKKEEKRGTNKILM